MTQGVLAVPGVVQCGVDGGRLPGDPYSKADEDRVRTEAWELGEVEQHAQVSPRDQCRPGTQCKIADSEPTHPSQGGCHPGFRS